MIDIDAPIIEVILDSVQIPISNIMTKNQLEIFETQNNIYNRLINGIKENIIQQGSTLKIISIDTNITQQGSTLYIGDQ